MPENVPGQNYVAVGKGAGQDAAGFHLHRDPAANKEQHAFGHLQQSTKRYMLSNY